MDTRYTWQLVAHRGNAADFPENTLPAFRSALQLGVRYLELDVQLSADEVPVVIHDHTLLRTTGEPGTVFEHQAGLLAEIEAAERSRLGDAHAGTQLPLLSSVLELLASYPEVTLFVEIKRASLRHFGTEVVVGRVLRTLRPYLRQCSVISFDLPAIIMARQHGALSVGWVLDNYDAHTRFKCEALRPEYLFCGHEDLPTSGSLWRGPWRWAVYEVQSLELAVRLAAQGALLIETMKVRAMQELMAAGAAGTAGAVR